MKLTMRQKQEILNKRGARGLYGEVEMICIAPVEPDLRRYHQIIESAAKEMGFGKPPQIPVNWGRLSNGAKAEYWESLFQWAFANGLEGLLPLEDLEWDHMLAP